MRTTAIDDPVAWWSVSLSCAKAAERIDVLLGVETVGDSRNVVLGGGSSSPTARGRRSMPPSPNYFDNLFFLKVKGKGKCIAVCETSPHRYGKSLTIWDHTVLPATRQR